MDNQFAEGVTLEVLQRAWPRILKLVGNTSPTAESYLRKAVVKSLDVSNGWYIITLQFLEAFARQRIAHKASDMIEAKICEGLKISSCQVVCELDDSPMKKDDYNLPLFNPEEDTLYLIQTKRGFIEEYMEARAKHAVHFLRSATITNVIAGYHSGSKYMVRTNLQVIQLSFTEAYAYTQFTMHFAGYFERAVHRLLLEQEGRGDPFAYEGVPRRDKRILSVACTLTEPDWLLLCGKDDPKIGACHILHSASLDNKTLCGLLNQGMKWRDMGSPKNTLLCKNCLSTFKSKLTGEKVLLDAPAVKSTAPARKMNFDTPAK